MADSWGAEFRTGNPGAGGPVSSGVPRPSGGPGAYSDGLGAQMNRTGIGGRRLLASVALLLTALTLRAASYLPMSDSDLAAQAPIIVRASVVESAALLEPVAGETRPVTLVTLRLLEAI